MGLSVHWAVAQGLLPRFGAFLNAHFHSHVCVIDGVFGEDAEGSVEFHEATHVTASDREQLQQTLRYRVLRYFHRQVPSHQRVLGFPILSGDTTAVQVVPHDASVRAVAVPLEPEHRTGWPARRVEVAPDACVVVFRESQ